ncbi:MAG: hypothetical protein IT270_13575 [Saprospiraceae bacterium]|nr:hypothetical protein [Saprospiraceae bacterium]
MNRFLILLFSFFIPFVMLADVRLPAIFGNNMMLQQQSNVRFWGWGAPGEPLTVECSWQPGVLLPANPDPETLQWQVSFTTPAASYTRHTITIRGGWSDTVLKNILFGEVWLCSGQSNMEWQPSWGNIDVTEAQYASANDSSLRFFTVPRLSVIEPQSDCDGSWQVSTSKTMRSFSATAFFFGRELRDKLGIPIALINASWGGTPIESWTPEEHVGPLAPDHTIWKYGRPGSMYNGMIAPLTSLNIAGFLWYQGESNTYNAGEYADLMLQMATDWRHDFGADKPFYYVQLAPWQYERPREGAILRDEQRKAFARIPNSGMIVISDIGNIADIHPSNKTDVGKRLSEWALQKHYKKPGKKALCGPLFRDATFEKGGVHVRFDFAEGGLKSKDGKPLTDFVLAGADRNFYPAKARIEKGGVWVWSDKVPTPVALRFAFENTSEPNLCNTDGLPASTFRTDDWTVLVPTINISFQYADPAGNARVKLSVNDTSWIIRYRTDGLAPDAASPVAEGVLKLPTGQNMLARLFRKNGEAADRIDTFRIQPSIILGQPGIFQPQPNRKFKPASGEFNLTDGLLGDMNYGSGRWVGYEGEDAVIMFDLGKRQHVKRVSFRFLSNAPSWIFLPQSTRVWFSEDSMNFNGGGMVHLPQTQPNEKPHIHQVDHYINRETRFLRIEVKGMGTLPEWHSGFGGKAWFFVDEVEVE